MASRSISISHFIEGAPRGTCKEDAGPDLDQNCLILIMDIVYCYYCQLLTSGYS